MRQHASVEINGPIEDVFDTTLNRVADWSLTVVESTPVDSTPEVVGSTFRCVTEDRGNRMTFDGVVTYYERPHEAESRLTGTMFDILVSYHFEDLQGRTRVTQTSHVYPKGMLKLFFLLFGWMMNKAGCKAAERELQSLKALIESEHDACD